MRYPFKTHCFTWSLKANRQLYCFRTTSYLNHCLKLHFKHHANEQSHSNGYWTHKFTFTLIILAWFHTPVQTRSTCGLSQHKSYQGIAQWFHANPCLINLPFLSHEAFPTNRQTGIKPQQSLEYSTGMGNGIRHKANSMIVCTGLYAL